MSILNKFKKKKFIYIIPIVIAAFSINYAFSDLTQGQHGYNATNLTFDANIDPLSQINNCPAGTVSLTPEGTGNKGAGSADISFSKSGSDGDVNCIITIQTTINPTTDAGVPTGNDWIDIDISFFYRIVSLSGTIDAHWAEVRLEQQDCPSAGAFVATVEKDRDPNNNLSTFDFVVGGFASHNPEGSAVLADLDPTIDHCAEIDLEIVATGGGGKSFQIFLDDILIEFSNESKVKINHDFQQGFGF